MLLEVMFSMSLLHPSYLVSMRGFLKTMSWAWHEIPRKVPEPEKIDHFLKTLRAAVYARVSAGLKSEHKLLWSMLLALQATGICARTRMITGNDTLTLMQAVVMVYKTCEDKLMTCVGSWV